MAYVNKNKAIFDVKKLKIVSGEYDNMTVMHKLCDGLMETILLGEKTENSDYLDKMKLFFQKSGLIL